MLGENSFWHDVVANGYQSRKFAETGDLDAVWASIRDTRDKVRKERGGGGAVAAATVVVAGGRQCTDAHLQTKAGKL